ncbi:hypothetical protein GGR52DRAFT_573047 [Hypoxylon sp. FL1284]|nr:hypothetical protein GGR52DRAFT_573047 [Hypoxylon sp. FL1284]
MGPTRSSTAAAAAGASGAASHTEPQQKRRSSLAGFFNKMLPRPSNRSEAGGTRRTNDGEDEDADDNEADMNPNMITDWSIAREKTSIDDADPEGLDHRHRSHQPTWRGSPQRTAGDSRFVENLPRARLQSPERVAGTSDRSPQQRRKSFNLTRAGIHETLKAKEETRRSRRSLKQSGDWLGVQGADPYSGVYPVLTPTDTPSSETTSSGTRSKLASLARRKKAAKLDYDQVRVLEEREKDRAKLVKEQAKLSKIERVKDELKRQSHFTRWSQHKRHWSSAAEPALSPIPQSLDSVALGSNGDDASSTIPNFSRPTRPPVSMNQLSFDSARARGQRHLDQSTDTIIHNEPDTTFDPLTLSRSASQPTRAPPEETQQDVTRTKSERHFLWKRRRSTDPGKSASAASRRLGMSMTAQNLTSNSMTQERGDHFAGLVIPDYHLHLLTPDLAKRDQSHLTASADSPPTSPNSLGMVGRNRMAMSSTINLCPPQENGSASQSATAATAIPSQPKLKGVMRHPSVERKAVPSPSTLVTPQPKETGSRQRPPSSDKPQVHATNGFPRDALKYQNRRLLLTPPRVDPERMPSLVPRAESHIKRAQTKSASIPTTTTTGYAPDQRNRLDFSEPQSEVRPCQTDGAIETSQIPPGPKLSGGHRQRAELVGTSGKHREPSPLTTPRSASPSIAPVPEIAENGTTSTHPVILEKDTPTRVSTPTTPRLCRIIQQNAETDHIDTAKDIADLPKITGTPKRAEKIRSAIPKPIEVRRDRAQEARAPKTGTERYDANLRRTRTSLIPKLHPREQQREMAAEAARGAVSRSRAAAIRSKSADGRTSRSRARTPNPAKKQGPAGDPAEKQRYAGQVRRPRTRGHSEEGAADIGLRSTPSESVRSKSAAPPAQRSGIVALDGKDKKARGPGTDEEKDEAMTARQVYTTIYMVLLGLACYWWMAVRPAFDQRSELWRRRHRKQGTWTDVVTLASAAAFCLVAVLSGWHVLRVLWCAVGRLV